ncbi:MAG: hypothetical protein CL609_25750 [Anaerolineaceae bacterium]|nr:hypothetical protein [Anaerolineaceae bacterium]
MKLKTCQTAAAQVVNSGPNQWRLNTPSGAAGVYHNAQLDDYRQLNRGNFPWQAPLSFSLEARVSDPNHNGTWGFGFWNDPFNASLGLGGTARRLPALPNTAWFFYASPPNHLTLHDHPTQGLLAATFRSPKIPSPLLAPGLLFAPFLFARPTARLLRKLAGLLVKDDASQIEAAVTEWNHYRLDWQADHVDFFLNHKQVFRTTITPQSRLGLVIWIDNQYAAFPPNSRVKFGTLGNTNTTSLEIKNPTIKRGRPTSSQ